MKTRERWVYFLKTTTTLSPFYFQLNSALADKGIILIPIEFDQIPEIHRMQKKKMNLVVAITSMNEKRNFKFKIRKSLERMISMLPLSVTVLSSFQEIQLTDRGIKRDKVFQIQLPITGSLFANIISTGLDRHANTDNRWPGRRGPLLSPEIVGH